MENKKGNQDGGIRCRLLRWNVSFLGRLIEWELPRIVFATTGGLSRLLVGTIKNAPMGRFLVLNVGVQVRYLFLLIPQDRLHQGGDSDLGLLANQKTHTQQRH